MYIINLSIAVHSHTAGNEEVHLLVNRAIVFSESTEIKSLPHKDVQRTTNRNFTQLRKSKWDCTIDKKKYLKKNLSKNGDAQQHSPYSRLCYHQS